VKFVPCLLTGDQRKKRQTIAHDLFEHSREDVQFLKNIVTGYESWVYGYNPETKQQSSQWKGPTSPLPKKGCQVQSKTKVMLLVFFDSEGIVLSPTRWLGWQGGSAPRVFLSAVWATELHGEDFLWDGVSNKATHRTRAPSRGITSK